MCIVNRMRAVHFIPGDIGPISVEAKGTNPLTVQAKVLVILPTPPIVVHEHKCSLSGLDLELNHSLAPDILGVKDV